jgi:hypothetical protein
MKQGKQMSVMTCNNRFISVMQERQRYEVQKMRKGESSRKLPCSHFPSCSSTRIPLMSARSHYGPYRA